MSSTPAAVIDKPNIGTDSGGLARDGANFKFSTV
jgi:hypothetical protein